MKILSTDNPGWTDAHRWALVFGPVLVSSSFGVVAVTADSRIDQIGVASFAMGTLTTLLIFARARRQISDPMISHCTCPDLLTQNDLRLSPSTGKNPGRSSVLNSCRLFTSTAALTL